MGKNVELTAASERSCETETKVSRVKKKHRANYSIEISVYLKGHSIYHCKGGLVTLFWRIRKPLVVDEECWNRLSDDRPRGSQIGNKHDAGAELGILSVLALASNTFHV